jgi:hypothetical protein
MSLPPASPSGGRRSGGGGGGGGGGGDLWLGPLIAILAINGMVHFYLPSCIAIVLID